MQQSFAKLLETCKKLPRILFLCIENSLFLHTTHEVLYFTAQPHEINVPRLIKHLSTNHIPNDLTGVM